MATFLKAVLIELATDGGHAAVHHVGGRDDVRSCAGVGKRRGREKIDRGIILHLAILHHAAVAVVRIFAEADVGDDDETELGLADCGDRALHGAIRRGCFRAGRVLALGQAEENHGGNAQIGDFAALLGDFIGGLLIDARHRANFGANIRSGAGEHGIDEAARAEPCLADQFAQGFGAAQAARAMGGECHARLAACDERS